MRSSYECEAAGLPGMGFATTRWSLVVRAAGRPCEEAQSALDLLCRKYWFPLYAYARRRMGDMHAAQDLTQAFFARLLEKDVLAQATPERGRFRSFLLASMSHFLANERDRQNAIKRGGGRATFSIDAAEGESRLHGEPSHELTPERLFERQWAVTLLERVASRLQSEFVSAGKPRHYELLRGALSGDRDRLPFVEIGAELGISEDAARQAAQRLRKRFREILRDEVSETVANPADIDEEIRSLFEALSA